MNLHLDGIFIDNTTFSYDDYEFVDQTKSECSAHLEAVFLPLLYSVALVVGLLGNGLLLVVLALSRRRQSWSVTDTLILHLAVADILLLFTLPFWAAQAAQGQGWSFGIPFCKISGAIFNVGTRLCIEQVRTEREWQTISVSLLVSAVCLASRELFPAKSRDALQVRVSALHTVVEHEYSPVNTHVSFLFQHF